MRGALAERRLLRFLSEPVAGASCYFFCRALGLLLLWTCIRFWSRGWIHAYYLEPNYLFTYWGFDWVKPWPAWGLYLHFAFLILCTLGIATGRFFRLGLWGFTLGFIYIELLAKSPYLNHYYALCVICLLLIGLSYLPHGLPQNIHSYIPRASLWSIRFQLGLIYVYAGLAKINGDWLLRAEPLQRWLESWSMLPLIGPWLAWNPTAFIMSWAGCFFDLSIPFLLLCNSTRQWAYACLIAFHLITAFLFPIGVFPWVMILWASIFFAPDWPLRRFGALFSNSTDSAEPSTAAQAPKHIELKASIALSFCALLLLLQFLLPLRFLLYPGQVLWTEEGFRFAWRVMLIEKTGLVQYRIYDPDSKRRWEIAPERELTAFQARMLSTQPDMIHQFALELARRWRLKGYPNVQVYAEAYAALNGRPGQRLIQADIDLAAVPRSWKTQSFIVPLKSE